jgi:hypothetical protein
VGSNPIESTISRKIQGSGTFPRGKWPGSFFHFAPDKKLPQYSHSAALFLLPTSQAVLYDDSKIIENKV